MPIHYKLGQNEREITANQPKPRCK